MPNNNFKDFENEVNSYENKVEIESDSFYKKLRNKIKKWAGKNKDNKILEYILLAPDLFYFFLTVLKDKDVYVDYKLKITGYLAYFISPIDIMPEMVLGPAGYLDDVLMGLLFLRTLLKELPYEYVEEKWPGDKEVLKNVSVMIDNIQAIIDSKIFRSVMSYFSKNIEKKK
ncbi:hypothetical protein Marpi_0421 [Marinitoga piezophila KA3]|uniref:DUF1232 domain-containing protein n=1 Tax=Marinitoga piezophila (strain DSM 14283 / JCM 11233 / KA3) TaxID=443254 RepID=H2J4T0_MARPK|nr:DUF1232 domain-containing protein [Marinitoga piezophila]AEX84865.1 hypothetical protein Marpi_0421 [Marinitoga piezophila KA3]